MSVEAISWALNRACVPADRGGQPSSACKFVLVGLANHAGPDGSGAFPSVATLVRYTGLSERTVRTCLDRLEASGLICPCDPAIVAAKIKRADRRPQGWDLNLALIQTDLYDIEEAAPERQYPGNRIRLAAEGPRHQGVNRGVLPPHPGPGPVDNRVCEVQLTHPDAQAGCNQRVDGVQPAQSPGAAIAPESFKEPSRKPSAATAWAPAQEADARGTISGDQFNEFFAVLADGWHLTASQRGRLATALHSAVASGWTPQALAAFVGANTDGVRNPYAVLAARLSPAELPPPPEPRPMRRPWCGRCDERTRRREDANGADAGRCRTCHPIAAQNHLSQPGAGKCH